jgi:hypothetical protein
MTDKIKKNYIAYYDSVRMIHAFPTNTKECNSYTKLACDLKFKLQRLERKNW